VSEPIKYAATNDAKERNSQHRPDETNFNFSLNYS